MEVVAPGTCIVRAYACQVAPGGRNLTYNGWIPVPSGVR
jgi:hypothetical protein